MTDDHRTPEERERARAERAARRSGEAPSRVTQTEHQPRVPRPPSMARQAEIPPERPPVGRRAGGHGPRPARRGPGRALALAALGLLALIVLWFVASLFQPFHGEGGGRVAVTVPRGADLSRIADVLEERGVVGSARFFSWRARLSGRTDKLKSGNYTLREDMAYAEVLDALEKGPPPARTINITIPEGRARAEVAPLAKQAGIEGSYARASTRHPGFRPAEYGARGVRNLEGFLFPATYELKRGATARDLVGKQLEAFQKNFATVGLSYAERKNLTAYDVLIIASMVEREAQVAKERPLVAAVIYNRLKQGMPLGIDATVRFAVDNWTSPLKESELATDSPYNTRKHAGLPPGPIGSPGLESIKAAARPARVNYLFYVVKPGTCGEHNFSATDAEFQKDVDLYNREREKAGGKSPTTC